MTNETEHEIEPLDLPGLDEAEPAPVLILTARPREEAQEAAQERAHRWNEGETVPEVINFEDPARLRKLLTKRRMELLESILTERPDSIRELASRLDRGVKEVNNDVNLLAEYGIVHFEQEGRAKVPYVPYDRIRMEVELGARDNVTSSPA